MTRGFLIVGEGCILPLDKEAYRVVEAGRAVLNWRLDNITLDVLLAGAQAVVDKTERGV